MINDIGFIYNTTNIGRTTNVLNPKFKHSSKPATLIKDSNNFHKITENNIISTSGEQPLLLYRKKEPKISHSFDYKMTKKNSDKNIYISDGGLKLKNEKFNSGINYTNTNHNHKQIKSLRTYLESININKILKTPAIKNKKQTKTYTINSKKHLPTEEQIFYKTVRGSSNRPAFKKKLYNIEKHDNHTGEGFRIREKIENKKKLKNLNKFEESKKTEENKNELIDSLIHGPFKINNFLIQKNENKLNPNKILTNKKREYLERNGIGVSDVNLDENEKQIEKDEINKMSKTSNNFHHVKLNNYVKMSNGFSQKQKNFYMTLNNETHLLNNNSKNKKSYKPIVDQFEYIKKINKHKRLHTCENLSKKERAKILMKNDPESNANQLLNDSFRHKNAAENQNKPEIQNIGKRNNEKTYLQKNKKNELPSSLIDVNNDEWPYSHKRSYRSPKELNKFVKEKKLQSKQKVNNDEIQKNKKLFIKFKNLYNLNYQRISKSLNNQPNQEKIKELNILKDKLNEKDKDKDKLNEKINDNTFSTKFSMTNKSIKMRQNNTGIKKRKEANEYYVGNDSFINSNSTLIDPNEYYLNVLESQQLLVNSGLNKIGNESEEETEEITDVNDDNLNNNEINDNMELKEEFNTSKEQIQKITKKESKRNKNNNINKNSNINPIKNNFGFQKNYNLISNNNTNINNKKKNNKKEKTKSIINPKNIIKLVEVIKFIIQRKIFVLLYKSYINEAIYQHYYIAFTFFIAVCKNKTFRKIEEYTNYKAYNGVFRKMLLPFIRRGFRTFIHNYFFKRKIEILIILLTKFFKYKIMEKIYLYSHIVGGEEEERQFKLIILKIMKTLFKPHLKVFFDKLKYFQKEKNSPNKINEEKKVEIKMVPVEKAGESASKNRDAKGKDEGKNEEKYKKINKRYLEYSPTHNNKARSYMYESLDEESSYYRRPNSLDNDKWHQIQIQMQLNKYIFMKDGLEEEEMDDYIDYSKYKKFNYPQNNSFNSKKSEISSNISNEKKKEIKNIKEIKEIKDDKKDDKKIISNKIESIKNNNEEEKDIKIKENEKEVKIKDNEDKKIININNILENIRYSEIIEEPKNKNKNDINTNKEEIQNNKNINININKDINKEHINKNNINNLLNENKDIVINKDSIDNKEKIKNQNDIKKENKNEIIENKKVKEDNNVNKEEIKQNKNIKENSNKEEIKQNKNKMENTNKEEIKQNKNEKENSNKEEIKQNKNKIENSNKEEINNIIIKKEIKEKIIEEDEKIISNDIQNKPNIEEKQKKNKKINENINAPKKEKKKIDQDDLPDKNSKNKTLSEMDISAERDEEYSIDWEYNLNNSKNKLKESDNSENLKNEEPKKEIINNKNNINIKEENKQNKIVDKKEIPKNKEEDIEKNKKVEKKIGLIDDENDKNEESDISELIDKKEDEKKEDIKKSTKSNKTLKKDKKKLNESEDEYLDEFEDLELDLNSDSEDSKKILTNNIIKKEKEKEKEKENEKEKKVENNKDKSDKSRNNNLEKNIKDIQNEENKKDKIKEQEQPVPELKYNKEKFDKIDNKEQFAENITDIILKNILDTEIKSNKIKLIPHKSFKYEFFTNLNSSQSNLSGSVGSSGNLNKELGLLGLNQLSLNDDLSSLNDSIMSSYSAFSIFNRTVKDKKKEHSLSLYYKKIAPKLIKLIKEEIYLKYPRIYENISTPLKNQSVGLMMSLSLQDADMLRDNYKCILMEESIKKIIDKEKILKKFQPINKHIRSLDNLTSDNFYDNYLNECLIDTAIELINKERLYGENGDPLAWSSRTHELVYKYQKDDPKKLASYVCKNILKTLHTRIGLLTENYDYLNAEQINNERDKRLINNIRSELDEDEYQWRNLEMEETQLKVEIAELIMDQLYNENIEILEHIQFSRNRPDLYQNKSIYACEEIPKLSFQQTTTENANRGDDGDEVINV